MQKRSEEMTNEVIQWIFLLAVVIVFIFQRQSINYLFDAKKKSFQRERQAFESEHKNFNDILALIKGLCSVVDALNQEFKKDKILYNKKVKNAKEQ
jgi:hypothetical protein